ncbi:AGE1 [Candida oxycetoniae]|uniref:ADP-ribosylation factor GTPase-activating protein n=1 Tax=Candida oxycetoniae TaxID=497107 RepID=A0AAI9SW77_9ASCO|nr:AGE1 [Candida oxycetoniae]KAI3403884.2 AGE1 [Candida oxycetoniae]
MQKLSRISFPYKESIESQVRLNKFVLTNKQDTERTVFILGAEDRFAYSCSRVKTDNVQKSINEPFSYIENQCEQEKNEYPLLTKVGASFDKIKLHVSIKPLGKFDKRSLLIVKSKNIDDLLKSKDSYITQATEAKANISKIEYKNLPIEEQESEFQKLIINDSFDTSVLNDTRVVVSLWEHNSQTNQYTYFFHLSVWIDKLEIENTKLQSHQTRVHHHHTCHESVDEVTKCFSLGDFRKEFQFNIEDGPQFRKALTNLENAIPIANKVYMALIDDFKILESNVRRISTAKARILEGINQLMDLESRNLLQEFGFKKAFHKSFIALFDSFEKNINFFLDNVCDHKFLTKILNSILPHQVDNSNQSVLLQMKKQFEGDSKEYYSWMNKYLSNDKERPESKLLAKRKVFELSKFDYLNQLSKITNSQYVNELCEKLFKFINLGYTKENPRLLDTKRFLNKNSNHVLIDDNYQIYLHVLTKFNSEKYQFRQMIEACQTNDELTNLIRYNRLNHVRQVGGQQQQQQQQQPGNQPMSPILNEGTTDEFIITRENFDLIFSDSKPPNDHINSFQGDTSEISGILFTLGGQKKQGWHKEWVVLKKGQLIEYADWRKGKTPINKPIEIALSSVKALSHEKRQHCFEILTSDGHKHVFQAFGSDDRKKWVKALYNAGQLVNTERLQHSFGQATTTSKPAKKHPGRIITDFGNRPFIPGQSSDRAISPVSITSKIPVEKDYLNLVRTIPNSDNNICVDCSSMESVEWIAINSLTCLCINCASCHRSMGSHITKIRSLKLDKFENEMELLLRYVNNREVNACLEATMPRTEKIHPNVSNEVRLAYIKDKYCAKKYVSPVPGVESELVKAIQKINISDVLKYILSGADVGIDIQVSLPNSNETEVISLFEYSLRKYIEVELEGNDSKNRKYFVISELLILNECQNVGDIANVGKEDRKLVLSKEAVEYWKTKLLTK